MPASPPPDDALPLPGGDSLERQLDAEIADHLASAAAELERHGTAAESATRQALARFGSISTIKRRCWWIHHGDQVMARTLNIALLATLTIAVLLLGFGGWKLLSHRDSHGLQKA